MIKIIKDTNELIFEYTPERFGTIDWIDHSLAEHDRVNIRKVFTFTKNHLIPRTISDVSYSDDIRIFRLGTLEGEYYKISKDILDLKYDLRLHHEMEITRKTFVAERDISIFRKIDNLIDEPIIVGGDEETLFATGYDIERIIPVEDFNLLIKTFPSTTELNHYAASRITRILKDHFGTMTDAELNLSNFFKRKKTIKKGIKENVIIDIETKKFEYIYAELTEMLDNANSYIELEWQKKIVSLLLLIFPKYIAAFESVPIKDFYSTPGSSKKREIDFMLIAADGHIDIIEIKRPAPADLISSRPYRDNYKPLATLSGAVMQAEKYLFHLNKWGIDGEKAITNKYKSELPAGFQLNITNPKAILILGRDNNLDPKQRFDFEFVRRQYSNVIDIITYDDLLRRVKNIIDMLEKQSEEQRH